MKKRSGQGGTSTSSTSTPPLTPSVSIMSPKQSTKHCAKYIVRSDGTIKFLRGTPTALEPLSQSAPTLNLPAVSPYPFDGEMLLSAGPSSAATSRSVSRVHLLAPLGTSSSALTSRTSALSPIEHALNRHYSGEENGEPSMKPADARASTSFQSLGGHRLSIEDAMNKGSKFAPVDHDISKIASHGVQELREEETARLCVPASNLGLRQSAVALEASLRERLAELHRNANTMGRFEFGQRAQRIFNDIMYEMVRQVGVQCAERAQLLATIWTRSSEIINALSAMFLDERERHATEENKIKEELRASRKDYLLVVQQLERMVEQEFESQTALLGESEKREVELTQQINMLKDELQAAVAKLTETERAHRVAQFQKPRPLASVETYGLDTLPALCAVPSGAMGKQSKRKSSMFADDTDEEITPQLVASLKAELQRQQVLLLDAVEEVRQLKGDVPNSQSKGIMAVPSVTEIALDPCEELATESDSEEDEAAPGKALERRGSRVGNRRPKKK